MKAPSYRITSYAQHIPGRRTLHHFPVFDVGEITDSAGRTDKFTRADLEGMVKAFNDGVPNDVPIVLGHVSPGMVKKVAKALDIEPIILEGEGATNKGAARLGEFTGLYVEDNDQLSADLALHPKVARLVDEGLFTSLSIELAPTDQKQYPRVVSRCALLGAQRPAVKTLGANLQDYEYEAVATFAEWTPPYRQSPLTRHYEDILEGSVKAPQSIAWDGSPDAIPWEVPMRFTTGGRIDATVSAADHISAKSTALRVVENFLLSATGPLGKILGGVVGTIIGGKLVGRVVTGKPLVGDPKNIGNVFYKLSAKNVTKSKRIPQAGNQKRWLKVFPRLFGEHYDGEEHWFSLLETGAIDLGEDESQGVTVPILTGKIIELQEQIEGLQYQVLVGQYQEEVSGLEYVPGTRLELSERLASIHSEYSEEDAVTMLRMLRTNNERQFQSGAFDLTLVPGDALPRPSDFNRHYEEFRKDNPDMPAGDAYRQARKDFYKDIEVSTNG